MKMIRSGHYQTTIPFGHHNDLVINIVKVQSKYEHKIITWRLTIADTLIQNEYRQDFKSKGSAVAKAFKVCQDILISDIQVKCKKAFPEKFKKGAVNGTAESGTTTERAIPSTTL
tara:strand:- start:32 stop:376 length:345 start_codon:yes stop_codon:yes gene_type:complete